MPGRIRKQQLGACCHCCFNSRHRCHTRSAAVSQFAQHTAAAEIIPTAAAWTDMALVTCCGCYTAVVHAYLKFRFVYRHIQLSVDVQVFCTLYNYCVVY